MKSILAIFLIIATNSYAQKDSLQDCKTSIKISPLSIINLYDGPCLKLGVETKLIKNIAFYAECGGYIPVGYNHWWWKKEIQGFQFKTEIKAYLNNQGTTSGNYLSIEYYYKNENFGFWATIKKDTAKNLQDYHLWKESSAFNLKFGNLSVKKGGKIIVEYFVGAGVWLNNGRDNLTDTERNNIVIGEGQGGLAAALIRAVGQQTWLSVTAGLKIGLRTK